MKKPGRKRGKFVPFGEGLETLEKRFGVTKPKLSEKAPVTPQVSREELGYFTKKTIPAILQAMRGRGDRRMRMQYGNVIQHLVNSGHISQGQAEMLCRNFRGGRNYEAFLNEKLSLEQLLRAERAHSS
ncbi:MAG: hypothetical protein JXB14_03290 [Candidatus Altiarchaeota archaeon]|nr:hypothetical protein [Candidatus Altiarchaeota archaeon]